MASLASSNSSTTTNLSPQDIKRYSRQLICNSFGMSPQTKLSNSTILLVGAGGLGSSAALYLAAAGVGTLHLVDGDIVERSNLHRQIIHTEAAADLQQYKVLSAANALKALNSSCNIQSYPIFVTCNNVLSLLEHVDLVVDGTDNVATRYILSDACVLLGKPLVSGAAIGMDGQATVYNYENKGPCYRCRFPKPPNATRSCSDAGVLGPVPGLIGVLLAMEAIKIISNVGTPLSERMYHYDALEGRSMVFQLPGRRKNCIACGGEGGESGESGEGGGGGGGGGENDTTNASKIQGKIQTMEDTCRFLEEHHLFPKEESRNSKSSNSVCAFDQEKRKKNQNNKNLSLKYCVTCEEYSEIRLQNNLSSAPSNHILLDVRVANQFDICSLPGAINIPLNNLASRMTDLRNDAETIYIICRRGIASVTATKLLLKAGFNNVRNINGGLDKWSQDVDPSLPMY